MSVRRKAAWAGLILAAAGLVVLLAAVLVLQSDWFRNQVRLKLVSVVEDATGGRVEVGAFEYDWRHLTATVAGFVVHGTEPPGAPPLFRAAKVEAGLRMISILERRVDFVSLAVDKPEVRITVSPDGRTNVPTPKIRWHTSKNFVQDLLDLQVRRLSITGGFAEYDSRRIPLNVQAQDVNARLRYEAGGPRYAGDIQARVMHLNAPRVSGASFQVSTRVTLNQSQLRVEDATVVMGDSRVRLAGAVLDFSAPHGSLNVDAAVRLRDVTRVFHLPAADRGEVHFSGQVDFTPEMNWSARGSASGRGLTYAATLPAIDDLGFTAQVKASPDRLEMRDLAVSALGGAFHGRLEATDWKKFDVQGEAHEVSVERLARLQTGHGSQLRGAVSGPVHVTGILSDSGVRDVIATGKLELAPAPGGIPLQGFLDVSFDQQANRVSLGNSTLNVGSSHMEVSGALGQSISIHASSRSFTELLAALPLAGVPIPKDFPIALKGGVARFDGTISGPLDDPRVSGQADLTRFTFRGEAFDHFASNFDLARSKVTARSLSISQGEFHLQGSGQAALTKWQLTDASAISASISLRGAEIQKLLAERGSKLPIHGIVAGTAEIRGAYGMPEATAGLDAEHVTAWDEPLRRVRASVILSGNTLRVIEGHAFSPAGQVDAKGSYQHAGVDWSAGQFQFQLTARGVDLAQLHTVQTFRKGLGGRLDLDATGTAHLTKDEFRVETVASQTTVREVSFEGQRYGNLAIAANSHGTTLGVRANGTILGTPFQGSGEWKMEGDDPGHGDIEIPHLTVATLHRLIPNPARTELPFDGFLEGHAAIDVPLRKPDLMKAEIRINALQLNAIAGATPRAGARPADLVLRNSQPIVLQATAKEVRIRGAQLTGTDTTIEAQGVFSLDTKNPWDLHVKGSINLAILQLFNPNLLASGRSVVDAAIRGSLTEPQVDGRMELRNASLYVTDLPNGLDQANGVILFDRGRATVDSLSAATGGGRVTIQKGSFVGFRGPALQYRIQASGDHVRYRTPEGVSVTMSALLNLVGSSDNSVLSGTVTVIRAGFNPTTDVGGLLANAARPVSAPSAPNEYLRGMQFDVRVESAQSLEIQTSLTRNIEAEANLRVRGTPERPVVLGNLTVNEGELEFFGNRYAINRGEVNFYNPVKIEPVIDMDLETVVRGITVDVTFSGSLNKLNFSYRSDPPLQTNEIIALLAVGRTPGLTGALASSQPLPSTSYISTSNNNLLSQAINAPLSGRLQRFFGVNHLKIDPQVTDITSVPQARLTLEQQISKEVTLTYITNPTRTQEQVVRVEWNLNRQWSVIALRDENGAFGIDFQYRKRFK